MLIIPGPIPIAIHPLFWLFSAFIGWLYGQNILGMLIWIGIIFVSVLIHEYGHAITAICFRQKAKIQLVAFGGLTTYDAGPSLKFWQQFFIVLNGPLFGFGLCFLATLALKEPLSPLMFGVFRATQVANFFWSAVNLLPILPLDGGQLLRIALEGFFGVRGFRASLLLSSILAVLIACATFAVNYFLAGAFFFLFAFQSFDSWRKSRFATKGDRQPENNRLMADAEIALKEGRQEEAKRLFEKVCQLSKSGTLFIAAAQYLAFFDMKEGKKDSAYQRLLPIKDQLAEESICLLHELAEDHKNDSLISDLSVSCYQIIPSQAVALRNARAFARLGQPMAAGGWLQTAWQHGPFHLQQVLGELAFAGVKSDPSFQEFIEPLKEI